MKDILAKAAQIKLVVFDVDGVLTDGSLYLGDDGQEYKAFHSRDGHGMKMLKRTGVHIAVITGRTSQVVAHRMANVGVEHVYQGHTDKLPAFETLLAKLGVEAQQTAFVGDDVVDLPAMRRAGLAIAVQDAHPLVKAHAHWQTPSPGGRGAARDVCELIMEAQGHLDAELQRYLEGAK
ncbi:MAG: 3-deoxy-manno-octulosonate-8-phosphatase KdsC [Proteobacteria bacterium]|nr:3-deoxy-manno-octulosonate-8-phosphatase KdsC [Pseudomonadota bacterium]